MNATHSTHQTNLDLSFKYMTGAIATTIADGIQSPCKINNPTKEIDIAPTALIM